MNVDEIRAASTWGEAVPANTLYWDINGNTAGAGGATPSGTWNTALTNWSASANGDASIQAWSSNSAAIFSAGTDATSLYTVTVSGTQTALSLTFEEGSPTLTGGTINLTGGLIAVRFSQCRRHGNCVGHHRVGWS